MGGLCVVGGVGVVFRSREVESSTAAGAKLLVGGPDAPEWLALYVEERDIAKKQAALLVEALNAAQSAAKAVPISDTDHGRMNREIGTPEGAAQTQAIDAFLARVFK